MEIVRIDTEKERDVEKRARTTKSNRQVQPFLQFNVVDCPLLKWLRTPLLTLTFVIIGWGISIAPGGAAVEATDLPDWGSLTTRTGPHYNASSFMGLYMPHPQIRVTSYWLQSDPGGDFRMAFYAGGNGYWDPSSAVLVNDTGILSHSGGGWQKFDVNFDVDKTTHYCGIAFKTANPGGASFYSYDNDGEPGSILAFYDISADDPIDVNDPFNPLVGANSTRLNRAFYYYIEYLKYAVISSAPSTLNDGMSYFMYGDDIEWGNSMTGHSSVYLTENPDWDNPGLKVEQTNVINGLPGSIYVRAHFGGLSPGTTAYIWVVNDLPNKVLQPVYLELPDSTPPVETPDTLSITPDDGVYVSASFSISETFEDPETRVFRCGASRNGSSFSYNGVAITDNGDNTYTCNSPSLSGTDGQNLIIQMKARSGGDYSTPVATLYRTIDAMAPNIGTFTAVSDAPGSCTLNWSDVNDLGTGLHPTQPYDLWKTTSPWEMIYSGTDTSYTLTGLENGTTYTFKLEARDGFDNSTMSDEISCTPPAVIVDDGETPLDKFANASETDLAVSSFALTVTEGTETISGLVVTGTGTSNVSNVKIYQDTGTIANEHDGGDTLMDTGVFIGDQASISGLNISVSQSPAQYLITFDIIATPADSEILTGYVSALSTQSLPVTSNDDADATITIDTMPPVTSDDTPADWLPGNAAVTFTVNDGSGSGVDFATGIYGCLGSGCVPVLLGSNSLANNCEVDQACSLDVRYYSIDKVGNTEEIKIASNQLKIDRAGPVAGTFEIIGNTNPILLRWSGYSDAESGIASYEIRRADGSVPPADCASGTSIYQGTDNVHFDWGAPGQQYSYRLCVSDLIGNQTSDTGSATAENCFNATSCNSCHERPPGSGGLNNDTFPPRGHLLHVFLPAPGGIGCDFCHGPGGFPSHVNGIINITPESGHNMGDLPFPAPDGGSCGGVVNPVGGPGNPMGCHVGGAPNYPSLTPDWECMWEEIPECTQSP